MKKPSGANQAEEEPMKKVKRLIAKEGADGWNLAKETLCKQEARSEQLREALDYVATLPDFFRPSLLFLCCKAVGGDARATIPFGASLILLGKGIGIHDDIIDNVKARKGRITAFGKFGKDLALVLSDVLIFKGFTLLRKSLEVGVPPERIATILGTMERVWFEQSEGEMMELQSRKSLDISPRQCLAKIGMRASEFEVIACIGGILGGGSKQEIQALGKYGRLMGTASLLRDELIDMLEFSVLKHRIKHESLPLPLIFAAHNPRWRRRLSSLISGRKLGRRQLRLVSKLADEAGGMDYVAEQINKVVDEACSYIGAFKTRKELILLAVALKIDRGDWKPVIHSM